MIEKQWHLIWKHIPLEKFTISFISLLFFHLGYRTKASVKKVENCVKKIEASFGDEKTLNPMVLFSLVDSKIQKR